MKRYNSKKKEARILWTCMRSDGFTFRCDLARVINLICIVLYGLEKEMMLACGGGSRRQGRLGRRWMDEMHKVSGMKLVELRDVTTERKQWRRLIMRVSRVPGTDSTRSFIDFERKETYDSYLLQCCPERTNLRQELGCNFV